MRTAGAMLSAFAVVYFGAHVTLAQTEPLPAVVVIVATILLAFGAYQVIERSPE